MQTPIASSSWRSFIKHDNKTFAEPFCGLFVNSSAPFYKKIAFFSKINRITQKDCVVVVLLCSVKRKMRSLSN